MKYWILKVRAAGLILALAFSFHPCEASADESTGLADDPKDLSYRSTTTTTTEVMSMSSPFLPLPEWSRFEKMPPLPDQLKPLGKKTDAPIATTPVILRKDPGENTPAVFIPRPKNVPVVTDPNPTLIAVSPFLQWIKDHPKDAADQARKEAATYNPPAGPAPSNAGAPAPGGSASPYWMPPLIDSSDTTAPGTSSSSSTTGGGSAAIYSTPQRN